MYAGCFSEFKLIKYRNIIHTLFVLGLGLGQKKYSLNMGSCYMWEHCIRVTLYCGPILAVQFVLVNTVSCLQKL